MSRKRILVIEDDASIRRGIADALDFEGYEPHQAADGPSGLQSAIKLDCEMILLDLVLPGLGGLEILREVRATRPTLPVIILTALGEEKQRVAGLRLGADDYVVKPFSVKELLARIEAVLRRSPERPTDVADVAFDGGVADLARAEVRLKGAEPRSLSQREAELLRYLALNAGRPISRQEILSRVWRINPRGVVATRTIDMHVARLRDKLGDDPMNPRLIRTVRGRGYMWSAGARAEE
jgi:DNA-binding response OmpR family regulator